MFPYARAVQYRQRRRRTLLPGSEWDRVLPRRYGRHTEISDTHGLYNTSLGPQVLRSTSPHRAAPDADRTPGSENIRSGHRSCCLRSYDSGYEQKRPDSDSGGGHGGQYLPYALRVFAYDLSRCAVHIEVVCLVLICEIGDVVRKQDVVE